MHDLDREVTGGVDTHGDVHVAAVVDAVGRLLGTSSFPSTAAGCRALLRWLRRHGRVARVGVEGTGSYGAGLARFLAAESVAVIEINRPNRQLRRRRGKSDTVDAEAAARAALNGEATGTPKAGSGPVESVRVLRLARRSAVKARTQAVNQIRDLVVTAPDELRSRLRGLDPEQRVAVCARFRTRGLAEPIEATKAALRTLARRYLELSTEIHQLDTDIEALCTAINPSLMASRGVGPEVAAALLVTAGDNPHRMTSEAAFAALCGASPVEASSGRITRHRLNAGGDRQANNALWRIAVVRMSVDPTTQAYVARRRQDGKTTKEIIRCLKRYIAREIFQLLTKPHEVPHGADLRTARLQAGLTLALVAQALSTRAMRISELERGIVHNADLAQRYQTWLDQQKAA